MLYSLLFVYNSLPFWTKIIYFLTFSIACVIALTIHEFSHAFVANKLGDNTARLLGRMTMNPLSHFDAIGLVSFVCLGFGWAKPVPINPYNFSNIKRDSFLVSLSGVLSNLLVAFIACPLWMLFSKISGDNVFFLILFCLFYFIYQVNLVFMIFNLLPIYPLDGYNAIASQLKYDNGFVQFMRKYGYLVLIFVIIIFNATNVFNYLYTYIGYPITWLWGLIIK